MKGPCSLVVIAPTSRLKRPGYNVRYHQRPIKYMQHTSSLNKGFLLWLVVAVTIGIDLSRKLTTPSETLKLRRWWCLGLCYRSLTSNFLSAVNGSSSTSLALRAHVSSSITIMFIEQKIISKEKKQNFQRLNKIQLWLDNYFMFSLLFNMFTIFLILKLIRIIRLFLSVLRKILQANTTTKTCLKLL